MKEEEIINLIDTIAEKHGTLLDIDELKRILKKFPDVDQAMISTIYQCYRKKYPDQRYPDDELNWEFQ